MPSRPRGPLTDAVVRSFRTRYGTRFAVIPVSFAAECWNRGMTAPQIMDAWAQMKGDKGIVTATSAPPPAPEVVQPLSRFAPAPPSGVVALPDRKPTEPLLEWLTRVQQYALDRALDWAVLTDPDLRVAPLEGGRGWAVLHIKSGLRINVGVSQEAQQRRE